ncbi:hypothetical protein CUJ83_07590 [Methanocella sp. CWC-04]|uniref:Uncharacterized protein n=1 Tax=Methanooceanicella nereidis TaxID=2052831 RepID=A0AAP2RC84_9EURY|nr:hypothetical protein [Methanocella sp. CWC-04]MCD1294859.1 hypothetical protein [Methanocella sp. CWC-04]
MKRIISVLLLLFIFAQFSAADARNDIAISCDIVIPSSFPVTKSSTTAYDSDMRAVDINDGNIQIQKQYNGAIYVAIPSATSGAALMSFYDQASGIFFRNNTMIIPLKSDNGEHVANLIMATEDLTNKGYGYYGRVTGIELDTKEKAIEYGGDNFSAWSALYLNCLPETVNFKVGYFNENKIMDAFHSGGKLSNVTDIELMVDISYSPAKDAYPISYALVSIKTDYSPDDNFSVYRYKEGNVIQLSSGKFINDTGGMIIYQAMSNEPGTIVLAGKKSTKEDGMSDTGANIADVLIFGTIISILIAFLALILKKMANK